jgi:Zn-dependent protease with chaperone function
MTSTISPVQSAAVASGEEHPQVRSRAAVPAGGAGTGRVTAAGLLLGSLALSSAAVAVTRLFESWRVGSQSSSHVISVLGQRLSYPVANAGAVVVLVLAGLGLTMAAAVASRLARELIAVGRARRTLLARASRRPDGIWVIDDDRPQAFCAGLLRSRVYISKGALELLDEPALAAVLAHERHHARRRDPLRLACGRALAAGLLFVPTLRYLVQRQQALAEIGADEGAMLADGVDRSALASAMLSFSQATDAEGIGIDPERIDNLLGEPTSWRFPLALCIATAAALAMLTALAVLAARFADGSATLAPPLLSSQPCVVVLALLPATALLAGAAYARTRRASRVVAPAHA